MRDHAQQHTLYIAVRQDSNKANNSHLRGDRIGGGVRIFHSWLDPVARAGHLCQMQGIQVVEITTSHNGRDRRKEFIAGAWGYDTTMQLSGGDISV